MTDSENRDNKPKVLGLKGGTNTVRQSFSHGRSKSVVVETKKKKLLISKKGPVIEENNKKSLLQNTCERILSIQNIAEPILVCNEKHRFIAAEQIRNINISILKNRLTFYETSIN